MTGQNLIDCIKVLDLEDAEIKDVTLKGVHYAEMFVATIYFDKPIASESDRSRFINIKINA